MVEWVLDYIPLYSNSKQGEATYKVANWPEWGTWGHSEHHTVKADFTIRKTPQ